MSLPPLASSQTSLWLLSFIEHQVIFWFSLLQWYVSPSYLKTHWKMFIQFLQNFGEIPQFSWIICFIFNQFYSEAGGFFPLTLSLKSAVLLCCNMYLLCPSLSNSGNCLKIQLPIAVKESFLSLYQLDDKQDTLLVFPPPPKSWGIK